MKNVAQAFQPVFRKVNPLSRPAAEETASRGISEKVCNSFAASATFVRGHLREIHGALLTSI
jgi:hypothetical protein